MLMSQEVHVNSVVLEEPQISIMRSQSGKWNFDSLGAAQTQNQKKPKAVGQETKAASSNFSVQNLKIKNGRITVVQPGKKHVYEDVNVTLENFSSNSAFPFTVEAKTPGNGSLSIEGEAGPIPTGDRSEEHTSELQSP